MAINFPATAGQATDGTFTYTAAGITYSWNGESWTAAGSGATATDLTVFSVASEPTPSGDGSLSYNNNTGEFTYTPPALSDYISKASQSNNVVIGDNAGASITNKTNNVFLGRDAGKLDIGSYNVAVGPQSGDIYWGEIQTVENIAIGRNAGNIRNGNGNIGIGYRALSSDNFNTNMFFGNVAIGYNAMGNFKLNGGDNNTCIGEQTGYNIAQGNNNVLVGSYSGYEVTSGTYNIFLGSSTGYEVTTGSRNLLFGFGSGENIITGSNNLIINAGTYQQGSITGFASDTSDSLWIGHSSYPWIKGTSSGNTRNVEIPGQLTAGGLTYPTSNGTSGDVLTSDGAGNVTWAASSGGSGLQTRTTAQATASNVVSNGTANISITTPATYALLKIQTSHAAWVTLYTDTTSRTNDASRTEQTDPTPGSGVIAEVITAGAATQLISPGIIGFNSAGTGTTYAKVVNKSGATASITVTLHYVQLEG